MEFRIVPIALTWSMDDETVNRFFPCNLVFSDRLSVRWARLISDNLVNAHRILISKRVIYTIVKAPWSNDQVIKGTRWMPWR